MHRSDTDAIPDAYTNAIRDAASGYTDANANFNAFTDSWRNSDA